MAVLAIEKAWEMDYAEALALGAPLYIGMALGTLPAGWLGDKIRREFLILVFFLGGGTSCLAISLASDPFWLMTGLGFLGLFAAIYHPVGISMITEATERRGSALAVNGVYGNMGLAVASVSTGFLADIHGWRTAFLLPGLVSLALGLWYGRRVGFGIIRIAHENTTSDSHHLKTSLQTQVRVIAVVMITALLAGFVFNAITISLPKLFELRLQGFASDLSSLGIYSGLVFAVAAFAQLPVGVLLDRYGAKPVLLTIVLFQIFCLVAVSQVSGPWIVPLTMLLVVMIFAEIPITGWLVGHYISSEWRSRVFSVEYILSLGNNALVVPLITLMLGMGLVIGHLYLLFSICAAIVLLTALVLPKWSANHEPPANLLPADSG